MEIDNNSNSNNWLLSCELYGHIGDLRCISSLGENRIVTASRDQTVKIWELDTESGSKANQYTLFKTLTKHDHWVDSLLVIEEKNLIITGCHDSNIRIFQNFELLKTIGGHKGPVVSLDYDKKTNSLLSGSWDGSCRVWNLETGECKKVLGNHENGVVVLSLPNGLIVTGSAGTQIKPSPVVTGFQLRLFDLENHGDQPILTMAHHKASIRSLCLLGNDFFATTGNSGSVIIYTNTGDLVEEFQNPGDEYNFCISSIIDGNTNNKVLVTGGDDCNARIWQSTSAAKGKTSSATCHVIGHPQTVWAVCGLRNGDLATGCSDGALRIFTSNAARAASDEQLLLYSQAVETAIVSRRRAAAGGGGGETVDVSKLEKIEEASPGHSDQQVKMFNKQGVAWVYQWLQDSQTWIEVGEVMNNQGGGDGGLQQARDLEIDGVRYDQVLPVEIEDTINGTGIRKLRIGINNGDNPYVIAQKFVEKHLLEKDYIQQIGEFIQNNRLTGPSSAAGIPMEIDSSSSSSGTRKLVSAPWLLLDRKGLCYDKFDAKELNAVTSKAIEFCLKFTNEDPNVGQMNKKAIEDITLILQNTSKYHATTFSSDSKKRILLSMLQNPKWSSDSLFPLFDLIRIMLIHPDGVNTLLLTENQIRLIYESMITVKSTACLLTGLRLFCNIFKQDMKQVDLFCNCFTFGINGAISVLGNIQTSSKQVKLAYVTLLLNIANYKYYNNNTSSISSASIDEIFHQGVDVLKDTNSSTVTGVDYDIPYRCVQIIGTCSKIDSTILKRIDVPRNLVLPIKIEENLKSF